MVEYECEYCNEILNDDDEVCRCVECGLNYCTDCGDFYLYEDEDGEYNNFICYPCYRDMLHTRVRSTMNTKTRDNKGLLIVSSIVGWINFNYSVNHVMGENIHDLIKAYRICHSKPPENPEAIVGGIIWK